MLLESGIDPKGMITFYEQLNKRTSETSSILKYLSTHPSTGDRIKKIKSLVRQSQSKSVKILKDYDWSDIKRSVRPPARKTSWILPPDHIGPPPDNNAAPILAWFKR